jgi:DNA-directed RNA polymerase subunit beta'
LVRTSSWSEGKKIEAGDVLVKIPRSSGKGGDITGGLPRVTELFEARNPSNPAVVSEIDGIISYGKIKRGNREIIVESRTGERKTYMVPLSKHILVQENDFIKAGAPLSDGSIAPGDILDIQGPTKVQEYLVDEVQEVYRMQGVKINDKHFEVIVRQMMRKVEIEDPGDTRFLERQSVNKTEFMEENDAIYDKMVVTEAGDSADLKEGQMISMRKLRDENSVLKRKDAKGVEARPARPPRLASACRVSPVHRCRPRASSRAASFQETTKVLNEAAVNAKEDHLVGLKENVIVGHLIPAGTGGRAYARPWWPTRTNTSA